MFATLPGIIFPVFAVAATGYLYARFRHTDLNDANRLNLEIFTPALIFSVLSDASFDPLKYQVLALAAAAVILVPGLLVLPACRLLSIQPRTLVPTMMFNNSGNMGLPLAVLAFGEQGLAIAMVFFVVENFLHFTVGNRILVGRTLSMQLLKLPMMWATITGIAFNLSGLELYAPLQHAITLLGQIAIPLMLFALGVRVAQTHISHWRIALVASILNPLLGLAIAFAAVQILNIQGMQAAQLYLFSVLPPAVLNYMLAEQFRQEPDKVASIVLLGNLSAIFVIPVVLGFVL